MANYVPTKADIVALKKAATKNGRLNVKEFAGAKRDLIDKATYAASGPSREAAKKESRKGLPPGH